MIFSWTYTTLTPANLGSAPLKDTFSGNFATQRVWSAQGVFDVTPHSYSFIF